jgi:cytochrome c oxidase subunit IV
MLVLVYVVDYFVGQIYARYVIVYTGAIFLLGLLVGQRSERKWIRRKFKAKKVYIKPPFYGSDQGLERK